MERKWFLYRPLMEGKVTMTELKTVITFQELYEINALLDMKQDIEFQQREEMERNKE